MAPDKLQVLGQRQARRGWERDWEDARRRCAAPAGCGRQRRSGAAHCEYHNSYDRHGWAGNERALWLACTIDPIRPSCPPISASVVQLFSGTLPRRWISERTSPSCSSVLLKSHRPTTWALNRVLSVGLYTPTSCFYQACAPRMCEWRQQRCIYYNHSGIAVYTVYCAKFVSWYAVTGSRFSLPKLPRDSRATKSYAVERQKHSRHH